MEEARYLSCWAEEQEERGEITPNWEGCLPVLEKSLTGGHGHLLDVIHQHIREISHVPVGYTVASSTST